MHCSFLATKLLKRVRRVGKLCQERAQTNPSLQHMPQRTLKVKKKGGEGRKVCNELIDTGDKGNDIDAAIQTWVQQGRKVGEITKSPKALLSTMRSWKQT